MTCLRAAYLARHGLSRWKHWNESFRLWDGPHYLCRSWAECMSAIPALGSWDRRTSPPQKLSVAAKGNSDLSQKERLDSYDRPLASARVPRHSRALTRESIHMHLCTKSINKQKMKKILSKENFSLLLTFTLVKLKDLPWSKLIRLWIKKTYWCQSYLCPS